MKENIKRVLVNLIAEHGVFAVAETLHQISIEEAENSFSPNHLKDRGPLSILNYEILYKNLWLSIEEMRERVQS